ncbi:MetQ/NlpA family ABC transporter substrate-binding protein, partial [Fusobacterium sp.]
MKKILLGLSTFLALSFGAFAGTLKVGASPVPHAELLDFVKPDLKANGVDLKVVEMSDYVTPNLALADGEIDANFFQHKPYLDKFAAERNLKLSVVANTHVEPLGLYSKKVKSVNDLKKGDVVAIPSDPSNGGRALILLHN